MVPEFFRELARSYSCFKGKQLREAEMGMGKKESEHFLTAHCIPGVVLGEDVFPH